VNESYERFRSADGPSWVGAGLGVAGLLASGGVPIAIGVGLGIAGGILLGVSLARLFKRGTKSPVRCLSCVKEFELAGEKGADTTTTEIARFVAREQMEDFTYLHRSTDGQRTEETFVFRKLGKSITNNSAVPGQNLALGHDVQIFRASPDIDAVVIKLPAPIKKGDVFEITHKCRVLNAFPKERETVGKRVKYSTDVLKFKVTFNGCNATNVSGTVLAGDSDREACMPLTPQQEGGGATLEWQVKGAEPPKQYLVTWDWA
jgi:hypothetical protein